MPLFKKIKKVLKKGLTKGRGWNIISEHSGEAARKAEDLTGTFKKFGKTRKKFLTKLKRCAIIIRLSGESAKS